MSLDNVDVDIDTYEVKFETSDFAQVVFLNVAENYPVEAHVECQYEVRPSLKATSSDWIGLFKVGWTSVGDYAYFHWVKVPSEYHGGRQITCEVLFMSHTLPKDNGEYYQFCYVTSEGQVRGASTPFQFRRPGMEDFVTIEDDDSDMLFVMSKTVALEEKLMQVVAKLEECESKNAALVKERQSVDVLIQELSMELTAEKEKNENLSKERQHLSDKIDAMDNEMKDMTQAQETVKDKVVFISKEKEEILKRLEENEVYIAALQGKIKTLLSEKDTLAGKQKMLEEERELYKNHFTTSEGTIQGYLREIADLKKSLHDESVCRAKLEQKASMLETSLEKEKKSVTTQGTYTKAAMEKLQHLTEKLKNAEDKLMAVEHCKMMLNDEVIAVHDAHDKMASSLEKALGEVHSLKGQICHLEEDNEKNAQTLRDEIQSLQEQNDSLGKCETELQSKLHEYEEIGRRQRRHSRESEGQEGAHYALKLAQGHLEKTLDKYKRKYDELKTQIDEMKRFQRSQQSTEKQLREEIQELKERLNMGAEQYKMKFIECRRLQKELKKIRRQPSSESENSSPERQLTPSLSRRESYTQVDTDELKSVEQEVAWRNRMDMFKSFLDSKNTRKLKYKQEPDDLVSRHREELSKYRELATNQEVLLTKIETESAAKCQLLQNVIVQQREEIDALTSRGGQADGPNPWRQRTYPALDIERIQRKLPTARARKTPSAPMLEKEEAAQAAAPSVDRSKKPQAKVSCLERAESEPRQSEPRKSEQRNSEPRNSDPRPTVKPVRLIDRVNRAERPVEIRRTPSDRYVERNRREEASVEMSSQPDRPEVTTDGASESPVPKPRLLDGRASTEPAIFINDQPLRCLLPPPIEPIVLPSAKIAAIRASSEQHSDISMLERLEQLELAGANIESEADDEKFQDAAGEPQKICPVCSQTFPSEMRQYEFEDHVEAHYGPVCPMCYRQFPDGCEVKEFEEHVRSHFVE